MAGVIVLLLADSQELHLSFSLFDWGLSTDENFPSKHFLISNMSWRRLEDVFNVAIFRLLANTSSRCLQNIFKTPWKASWRRLQDIFEMSSRRLGRQEIVMLKTSWRCRHDMSSTSLQDMSISCLPDLLTSWRPTKCSLGRNLYLFLININLCQTNVYLTNLYLASLGRV